MNKPRKHHYIPVFYLKRWAGPDGRIVEFSRKYKGIVKPRRTHPDGTGYVNRLYELQGVAPEKAQRLEEMFMQPVDSLAADALLLLERGLPDEKWRSGPRSAWTRFILSLILRTPTEISQLKTTYSLKWLETTPEQEEAYAKARSATDPLTLSNYLKAMPAASIENLSLRVLPKLIDHQSIGNVINGMRWFVIDTSNSDYELLTSDRPVLMAPRKEPDAYIFLPIGPRSLFAAVRSADELHPILTGQAA